MEHHGRLRLYASELPHRRLHSSTSNSELLPRLLAEPTTIRRRRQLRSLASERDFSTRRRQPLLILPTSLRLRERRHLRLYTMLYRWELQERPTKTPPLSTKHRPHVATTSSQLGMVPAELCVQSDRSDRRSIASTLPLHVPAVVLRRGNSARTPTAPPETLLLSKTISQHRGSSSNSFRPTQTAPPPGTPFLSKTVCRIIRNPCSRSRSTSP